MKNHTNFSQTSKRIRSYSLNSINNEETRTDLMMIRQFPSIAREPAPVRLQLQLADDNDKNIIIITYVHIYVQSILTCTVRSRHHRKNIDCQLIANRWPNRRVTDHSIRHVAGQFRG